MFSDIKKKGVTLAHGAYLLCEYVHLYRNEHIFIFCYEDFKRDVMFLYLLSCPWVEIIYLLDFKFFPSLYQLIKMVIGILGA
jgi:hypothetical protein